MIRAVLVLGLAIAACSPRRTETPAPTATPASLKDIEAAHDWANEPGPSLNGAFEAGAKAILGPMTRSDAITAINEAGFECTYGEAHQDYPDPMAVCTRSFATRACQMDWEIASTADKGKVEDVTASFKRDCVGTADDWPDKVESAIDNQLAPGPAPAPN
ncbi:MAG: hypothetical protein Q8R02_18295 [Hyphomonadaceae bacterium]|nr:hypothetical protein [Hyphomonadaceae bacterium]